MIHVQRTVPHNPNSLLVCNSFTNYQRHISAGHSSHLGGHAPHRFFIGPDPVQHTRTSVIDPKTAWIIWPY